ncbi:MAG: hypothetical protein AAGG75_20235 [Bacteroidota bacterium]
MGRNKEKWSEELNAFRDVKDNLYLNLIRAEVQENLIKANELKKQIRLVEKAIEACEKRLEELSESHEKQKQAEEDEKQIDPTQNLREDSSESEDEELQHYDRKTKEIRASLPPLPELTDQLGVKLLGTLKPDTSSKKDEEVLKRLEITDEKITALGNLMIKILEKSSEQTDPYRSDIQVIKKQLESEEIGGTTKLKVLIPLIPTILTIEHEREIKELLPKKWQQIIKNERNKKRTPVILARTAFIIVVAILILLLKECTCNPSLCAQYQGKSLQESLDFNLPAQVCVGDTINLLNTAIPSDCIDSTSWYLNDEEVSTDSVYFFHPQFPQTYQITLAINGIKKTKQIVAMDRVKNIDFKLPSQLCLGDSLRLYSQATPISCIKIISWMVNGQPVPGDSVYIFKPDSLRTYQITLNINGIEKRKKIKVVKTIADFRLPDSVCINEPIQLADLVNPGSCTGTIQWFIGDDSSPKPLNYTFQPSNAGIHRITLDVDGNRATKQIEVVGAQVDFKLPSSICVGESIQLSNTISSQVCTDTIRWLVGDDPKPQPLGYKFQPKDAGTYPITLDGNGTPITKQIIVLKPKADFQRSSSIICRGDSIQLTSMANPEDCVETTVWTSNNDTLSKKPSFTYKPPNIGKHQITLTVNEAASITKTVEVVTVQEDFDLPSEIQLCSSVKLNYKETSVCAIKTIAWYANDEEIKGNPDYTFQPTIIGRYLIRLELNGVTVAAKPIRVLEGERMIIDRNESMKKFVKRLQSNKEKIRVIDLTAVRKPRYGLEKVDQLIDMLAEFQCLKIISFNNNIDIDPLVNKLNTLGFKILTTPDNGIYKYKKN